MAVTKFIGLQVAVLQELVRIHARYQKYRCEHLWNAPYDPASIFFEGPCQQTQLQISTQ